jgi:hypothetical protein
MYLKELRKMNGNYLILVYENNYLVYYMPFSMSYQTSLNK